MQHAGARARPTNHDDGHPIAMVIEFLTFTVDQSERDEWLQHEERHWSRFLERQPGFVRKQMWESVDDPSRVHAVIWWESLDHWHAIPAAALAQVEAAMGPLERTATMTAFNLLRDC